MKMLDNPAPDARYLIPNLHHFGPPQPRHPLRRALCCRSAALAVAGWWQRWWLDRHNQRRDLGVEGADLLIEEVDVLQMACYHEAMMLTHPALQRLLQQLTLGTQPALSQLSQDYHITLPID